MKAINVYKEVKNKAKGSIVKVIKVGKGKNDKGYFYV